MFAIYQHTALALYFFNCTESANSSAWLNNGCTASQLNSTRNSFMVFYKEAILTLIGMLLLPTGSRALTPPKTSKHQAIFPNGNTLFLTKSPTDIIGTPTRSIGTPADIIGTPTRSIGCPADTIGCPINPIGTPARTIGCPAMTIGSPTDLIGTPARTIGTPARSIGSPARSIGSPTDPKGIPFGTMEHPINTIGIPIDSMECPTAIIGCPASIIGQYVGLFNKLCQKGDAIFQQTSILITVH